MCLIRHWRFFLPVSQPAGEPGVRAIAKMNDGRQIVNFLCGIFISCRIFNIHFAKQAYEFPLRTY